jgi:hypothetical protein
MKKLLLLTLAIVTLTNMGYSQKTARPGFNKDGSFNYKTTPSIFRGGVIVYEKNGHGLVVAPMDLSLEPLNESDTATKTAKTVCEESRLNGFSDWRLPTIYELNILYKKKDKIGGFLPRRYLSSTEMEYEQVWVQEFGNGKQYKGGKDDGYHVRAVRDF